MIVVRFPPFTHFRLRALEWGLGGIILTVGVVLLGSYPIFSQPQFEVMERWASENIWAWLCIVTGMLRLGALYINGACKRTPCIRLVTAILSSLVWLQITLGLLSQPIVTLGVAVFPWFIAADWYSIWRAANDARDNREALKELTPVKA